MKFSINWLAEFAGPLDVTPKELANLITLKTAEQEGVEAVGEHLAHVVVARVTSVDGQVATLDAGPELGTRTVYCGAPNLRAGIVSAYVPAGTTLGEKQIRKAVVHGVESDGMLASGAELGLNRDAAGILDLNPALAPGTPLPGCVADSILEIDNKSLTHRPDLWGHYGMAREVAAVTGTALRRPKQAELPSGESAVQVSIEDTTLCPRYSALVFENVTVQDSPLWLQYRLEAIGLNPINNIVDVTNYVMAELAQPMHAFDRATLAGDTIYVRKARQGESIKALNGETYALDSQVTVIADGNGPIAIGGVIGGLDTGVTAGTASIVLESANFHAGNIRKTSTRLKLRTDASMRFEKAQDQHNTTIALARAISLLEEVSPGIRLVGGLVDNCAPLAAPPVIELPLPWLDRKLGKKVPSEEVIRILEALEFGVTAADGDSLSVKVPRWRATKDISIKEDLAEEVGRMIGYTSITPTAPLVPATPPPSNPERDYFHRLRLVASQQGFTEVYNYSFLSEEQARELSIDSGDLVRVTNPIASDQSLLRNSLLPGILRNVRDNSRHLDLCRFFEIGFEIHKRPAPDLPHEIPCLGACVYSKSGDGAAGLRELKRLAECIVPGVTVRTTSPHPYEHPVRAWTLVAGDTQVGRICELHPNVAPGRAAVLLLDLEATQSLPARAVKHAPLRRFPSSAFDLSVLAPLRLTVGDLDELLVKSKAPHLIAVEFVREYTGPPLPEDRKSVSFRVTVGADDRTLSSDEINQVRATLIDQLQAAGYQLRI